MEMTVELNDMAVTACHGVMPQERIIGNKFLVTVHLRLTSIPSANDIAATVSYADIAAIVREVMAVPSQLIEDVALRLRDALTARWPSAVSGGLVRVEKLTPPMRAEVRSAAAALRW